MKIVAICGAGIGTSGILKVERGACARPPRHRRRGDGIRRRACRASAAADAQVILTSPELVEAIGETNADVIVIENFFDLEELEAKLDDALG